MQHDVGGTQKTRAVLSPLEEHHCVTVGESRQLQTRS